jgi:hypothetical protein
MQSSPFVGVASKVVARVASVQEKALRSACSYLAFADAAVAAVAAVV